MRAQSLPETIAAVLLALLGLATAQRSLYPPLTVYPAGRFAQNQGP
jgi:hypothetical protein